MFVVGVSVIEGAGVIVVVVVVLVEVAEQGKRQADEAEGEEEVAEEVGVHAGGDDELADVGFADLEAGNKAREDGGGGAGEEGGEAERELGLVLWGEVVEEGGDGAGEDEGGEDAGVGDLSVARGLLEDGVRVHFDAQSEHVEHHHEVDDEAEGLVELFVYGAEERYVSHHKSYLHNCIISMLIHLKIYSL